ncbi:MAG TPA: hypothetical protein VFR34_07210, partial [Paracoccaceae bacterium]|nr:hypothetical protein [Paracoccaceae bacterium]
MRRFVLALCILIASGLAAGAESIFDVRSQLVQFLLRQVSSPGSFEVTVEGVDSPGEGVTRLRGLKVADGAGTWIEAAFVSLSWNPSRLLRGELEIPQILVEDLAILRPPAPGSEAPELAERPPDPTASPFDWPRSPIALRIDELRLERVSVAEGVLAQAIRFDAVGAARDEGDQQSVRLELTRRDAVEGRIALDYLRDFAADTLRLTLRADEAPGGLVAASAGLPPGSRSRVNLTAEGPKEDWRLGFEAEAEQVFTAGGEARISYVAPLSAEANFRLTPGPAMGPETRAVFEPASDLTVRLSEEGGLVRLAQFDINSPALAVRASGSWSRPEGTLALDLTATGTPALAAPFPDVALGGFRFQGRVEGRPERIAALGRVELAGLRSPFADAGRLDLQVDVSPIEGGFSYQIDGSGREVRLDRLVPADLGPVDLLAEGNLVGDTLSLSRAELRSALLQLSASGDTDLAFERAALDGSVRLPRLGPAARAYGLEAEGAAELAAALTLAEGRPILALSGQLADYRSAPADLGRFRFDALVEERPGGVMAFAWAGTAEAMRLDRLGPDLLGEARLEARGELEGERLRLANATISAPLLEAGVSGEAGLDGTGLALDYRMRTPEIAGLAAAYGQRLAGALAAEGKLTGSAEAPALAGHVTATDFAFGDRVLGDLDLRHDARLAPVPEGHLEAHWTEGPVGEARLATDFRHEAPMLALNRLELEAAGLNADGDLAIDTAAPLAEGGLDLASRDAAALGRLLGVPLSGAF